MHFVALLVHSRAYWNLIVEMCNLSDLGAYGRKTMWQ